MCGFSGLFYFDPAHEVSIDLLEQTRRVAQHRGPDEQSVYRRGNAGLAFNRLSVIDLGGGGQPMRNEDGTVHVVCNGEIYNFRELRRRLSGLGHRFRSQSDTEAVVHAWEEYGEECPKHLRGMFAFVVYDERRKVLFGARDRLGIKPFYYTLDRERFAFASELKSLLEIPGVPNEIDAEALTEFLRRRYVTAPRTILKEIRKLPPGHSLRADMQGVRIKRYWELPLEEPLRISEEDACRELERKLLEVVDSHLAADVPLGVFLSGGLDSSAVMAFLSELNVPRVKTFSIGYAHPESELGYARLAAKRFRSDHHEMELTPAQFQDSFSQVVWHLDEPVGDPAAVPLFHLSRFARQQVTVALSGEGADELFAGYPIYRVMTLLENLNRVPGAALAGSCFEQYAPAGKWKKYGRMLGQPLQARYGGVSDTFSPEQVSRLLGSPGARLNSPTPWEHLPSDLRSLSALRRMSYLDLKTWLADDILLKADRMSMAHALELRVPFLDHELVEFAFRLPERLKLRGRSKYLLRKILSHRLPSAILKRPKKGFVVPTRDWFRQGLSGFARDSLLACGGVVDTYLERREVETVLASGSEGSNDSLFALLVLDDWYRQFAKRTAAPSFVTSSPVSL